MASLPADGSKDTAQGGDVQERGRTMRSDIILHSISGGNFEQLAEDLIITGKAASSARFGQVNNSRAAGQQAG
ncbi:MAG: hypothetical protein WBN57_05605 [Gammaproteobacteria bacterium]|jgi:hypothetical protein